jgi:phosphate starvation-inducible PhoH-like protein
MKHILKNIQMKKHGGELTSNSNIKPRTKNQELYINYLQDPQIKILCVVGPAGTGKTFMACHQAISLLKSNVIGKIIITRPVVPVEEDIGFLPGNLVKKMDPWTRPIIDVFEEKFSRQEIDNLIKNNVIEISPLAYMRGRTFKDAFIIADEMQNSSPNQMLMLTTRIGENSKMVITGDLKQRDKKFEKSGLQDFTQRFKEKFSHKRVNETGIQVLQLNGSDVQRSKVVSQILEMYEEDSIKHVEIKYDYIKNNTNIHRFNATSKKITMDDCALIPKHLYKELRF